MYRPLKRAARFALFAIVIGLVAGLALVATHAGAPVPHGNFDALASISGSGAGLGGLGTLGLLPFAGSTKTKFFRVATEGATVDGREIKREWIEQAAKNFDPKKYGARVWLEHLRGIYPDSSFKAYGDVTAVEARAVEDNKLALFAQIAPLPDLVKIVNNDKQKIYTSIELNPKFADTGEAYLVGLAVTDSPASTGTEVLSFATRHPTSNAVSKPELAAIELEPDTTAEVGKFAELLDVFKNLMAGTKRTDPPAPAPAPAVDDADASSAKFTVLATSMQDMATAIANYDIATRKSKADLNDKFAKQQAAHDALVQRLGQLPDQNHSQRPPATGNNGRVLADC